MKTVYELMSWLFGVLFLMASINIMFESLLSGLLFLLIALLLLPPIRRILFLITKIKLEMSARALFILVLLVTSGYIMVDDSKIKKDNMKYSVEAPEQGNLKPR